MHSFGYRANALLTFAITILALMCAMASLSDNFNTPTPSAQVQVRLLSLYNFNFTDLQFANSFIPFFAFLDAGAQYQLVSETAQRQWRGKSFFFPDQKQHPGWWIGLLGFFVSAFFSGMSLRFRIVFKATVFFFFFIYSMDCDVTENCSFVLKVILRVITDFYLIHK